MSRTIDAVVPALILLFTLMCAAYCLDAWRLIDRLRRHHRSLWIDLGEPVTADLFMYNAGWSFPGRPSPNSSIQRWLYASEYRALQDPVTTKLANRLKTLKVLIWIMLALTLSGIVLAQRR